MKQAKVLTATVISALFIALGVAWSEWTPEETHPEAAAEAADSALVLSDAKNLKDESQTAASSTKPQWQKIATLDAQDIYVDIAPGAIMHSHGNAWAAAQIVTYGEKPEPNPLPRTTTYVNCYANTGYLWGGTSLKPPAAQTIAEDSPLALIAHYLCTRDPQRKDAWVGTDTDSAGNRVDSKGNPLDAKCADDSNTTAWHALRCDDWARIDADNGARMWVDKSHVFTDMGSTSIKDVFIYHDDTGRVSPADAANDTMAPSHIDRMLIFCNTHQVAEFGGRMTESIPPDSVMGGVERVVCN
jgi:hypothetical protein